jgi:hypothetical protein
MTRRGRIWSVIALLAASATLNGAENLRIVPIVRDDQLVVSFDFSNDYTRDVGAAISSGLRTTFTYNVELRTTAAAWFDRTIMTVVVTTSDQYDNLTRLHRLSRMVDGRTEEAEVAEDELAAIRWLTTVTGLPLCRTSRLEPEREYYVRIRAGVRPHSSSWLGWAKTITGQAKFTFIP